MVTSRLRLYALCALLVSAPSLSLAQSSYTFLYHPDLKWRLGSTFDISDPFQYVESCVENKVEPASTSNSRLMMEVVHNEDELRNFMQIDAKLDAQFGPGNSANASFALKHERYFRNDQLTVVLIAEESFSFSEVKETKLSAQAAKLPLQQFRRRCGTHYTAQMTSGSKVAVLFTASNLTDRDKQSLAVGVGGSYSGTSAQVNFFQEFSALKKKGSAKIEVLATGGEGIPAFAGIAESLLASGEPAEIAKKLGEDLKDLLGKFGKANAAPVSYTAAPLSYLREDETALFEEELRYKQLDLLTARAREAGRRRVVLEAALSGEQPWSTLVFGTGGSDADRAAVQGAVRMLTDFQLELGALHRKCKSADDVRKCAVPDIPPTTVKVPSYPQEPRVGFALVDRSVPSGGTVCSAPGLVDRDVARAFLDGPAADAVERYRALHPSQDVELVFHVEGEELVSVARVFLWSSAVANAAASVAKPVYTFSLAKCGGVFTALDETGARAQLAAMMAARDASGGGSFIVELRDKIGRRFVSTIGEIDKGAILVRPSAPACQPSADNWTCPK